MKRPLVHMDMTFVLDKITSLFVVMATVGALGSLGGDLAFSVSFGIASELLDAAKEAHLSEEELLIARNL